MPKISRSLILEARLTVREREDEQLRLIAEALKREKDRLYQLRRRAELRGAAA